jgi:hypothetical protein
MLLPNGRQFGCSYRRQPAVWVAALALWAAPLNVGAYEWLAEEKSPIEHLAKDAVPGHGCPSVARTLHLRRHHASGWVDPATLEWPALAVRGDATRTGNRIPTEQAERNGFGGPLLT